MGMVDIGEIILLVLVVIIGVGGFIKVAFFDDDKKNSK